MTSPASVPTRSTASATWSDADRTPTRWWTCCAASRCRPSRATGTRRSGWIATQTGAAWATGRGRGDRQRVDAMVRRIADRGEQGLAPPAAAVHAGHGCRPIGRSSSTAAPYKQTEYLWAARPSRVFARLASDEADDLFCFGHTHEAWHRVVGQAHFVACGSVGCGTDGDARARYAVVYFGEPDISVGFRAVDYDHVAWSATWRPPVNRSTCSASRRRRTRTSRPRPPPPSSPCAPCSDATPRGDRGARRASSPRRRPGVSASRGCGRSASARGPTRSTRCSNSRRERRPDRRRIVVADDDIASGCSRNADRVRRVRRHGTGEHVRGRALLEADAPVGRPTDHGVGVSAAGSRADATDAEPSTADRDLLGRPASPACAVRPRPAAAAMPKGRAPGQSTEESLVAGDVESDDTPAGHAGRGPGDRLVRRGVVVPQRADEAGGHADGRPRTQPVARRRR